MIFGFQLLCLLVLLLGVWNWILMTKVSNLEREKKVFDAVMSKFIDAVNEEAEDQFAINIKMYEKIKEIFDHINGEVKKDTP